MKKYDNLSEEDKESIKKLTKILKEGAEDVLREEIVTFSVTPKQSKKTRKQIEQLRKYWENGHK